MTWIRLSSEDRERLATYADHSARKNAHFAAPGIGRFSVADLLNRLLSSSPSGIVVELEQWERAMDAIRTAHGANALAPGMECTCEFCAVREGASDA